MGCAFARAGWGDITIALPAYPGAIEQYREIVALGAWLALVVDGVDRVRALSEIVDFELGCWLEIEAGYARSGVAWDDGERILAAAREISQVAHLRFDGLLTHSGQTYACSVPNDIKSAFAAAKSQMLGVRSLLEGAGFGDNLFSMGDTPGCCLSEDFSGIDELRPGNFVFYDLIVHSCLTVDCLLPKSGVEWV